MGNRTRARRAVVKGVGAAAAAVAFGGAGASAQTPVPSPAPSAPEAFVPARHDQDTWFDAVPGKHRVVLDVTSPQGVGEATGFAGNLFSANKSGYGLDDGDITIVVCLRHLATVFAFTDPFWARHGKAMADAVKYTSRTGGPPAANPYNAPPRLALDALAKRGVRFMVCDAASHRFARMLAGTGDANAVYADMAAHLIASSRFVPAGVVGVTRAQEYGYSVLHVG